MLGKSSVGVESFLVERMHHRRDVTVSRFMDSMLDIGRAEAGIRDLLLSVVKHKGLRKHLREKKVLENVFARGSAVLNLASFTRVLTKELPRLAKAWENNIAITTVPGDGIMGAWYNFSIARKPTKKLPKPKYKTRP